MCSDKYYKSQELLKSAEEIIPLGSQTFSKSKIQYPKGRSPLFLSKGRGGQVWDIDGNNYVDLVCGLLPVVLGYADYDVDMAIKKQLKNGISFSLPTHLEIELAKRLVEIIPSAEMVRFAKNGTDATSAAIRLARSYTGRDHVIALGYHGWQDWYIGSTTRNKGVPSAIRSLTHRAQYNDFESLTSIFKNFPKKIAAVIMEPMSSEEPKSGYLNFVRDLTRQNGAILIFDEIITGFRFSLGGAQELFNIKPDLSCFGKAMGNGMPISAIVGKSEIMKEMEEVFISGTFGGESLSLAAAIAVIDKMKKEPVIDTLWSKGEYLANEVTRIIEKKDLQNFISLSGRAPWKIVNFNNHSNGSSAAIKTLYMIEMINHGVLTIGSHNICYAHSDKDLQIVLEAYEATIDTISKALSGNSNIESSLKCPVISPIFNVRSNNKN